METEKEIEARIRSIKGKISDLEIQLATTKQRIARFDESTPDAEANKVWKSFGDISKNIKDLRRQLNSLQ